MTALTCAEFFVNEVLCQHGYVKSLLTDNGRQFTSDLFKELLKLIACEHVLTSVYHPQTNAMVERRNAVIVDMLSAYCQSNQKNWDDHLAQVVWAYNTSRSETTKFSPYQLLYLRDPVLSIDAVMELEAVNDYVHDVQRRLLSARYLASYNTDERQLRDKDRYDVDKQDTVFKEGDKVMVWGPNRKVGKSEKLSNNYFGPYRIVKQLNNVTFRVSLDEGTEIMKAKTRSIHVSLMKHYHERKDFFDLLKEVKNKPSIERVYLNGERFVVNDPDTSWPPQPELHEEESDDETVIVEASGADPPEMPPGVVISLSANDEGRVTSGQSDSPLLASGIAAETDYELDVRNLYRGPDTCGEDTGDSGPIQRGNIPPMNTPDAMLGAKSSMVRSLNSSSGPIAADEQGSEQSRSHSTGLCDQVNVDDASLRPQVGSGSESLREGLRDDRTADLIRDSATSGGCRIDSRKSKIPRALARLGDSQGYEKGAKSIRTRDPELKGGHERKTRASKDKSRAIQFLMRLWNK